MVSIAGGITFQTVLGNMFAGTVILTRDRLSAASDSETDCYRPAGF